MQRWGGSGVKKAVKGRRGRRRKRRRAMIVSGLQLGTHQAGERASRLPQPPAKGVWFDFDRGLASLPL